jgi:hypothetical protein
MVLLSCFHICHSIIHELIEEILALDGGCKIGDSNTTILAYCDGIILLSHSLKKLEELIKIGVRYSTEWLFKFNANKSLIMNCGYKIYENDQIQIRLGEKMLETKETCKYLGLLVNEDNDANKIVIDKFKSVRKSFFSLNSFGMKPRGLNPFIKSFLYNSYCLPKLTYGMGLYSINKQTRQILNVNQNNLIRYMLDIHYKTHISYINRVLNILDMEYLYYSQICIVIKLLHRHPITKKRAC